MMIMSLLGVKLCWLFVAFTCQNFSFFLWLLDIDFSTLFGFQNERQFFWLRTSQILIQWWSIADFLNYWSVLLRYPNTSAWNVILGMNLWDIYGIFEAVCFCKKHPDATWDIFLYCCCGAIGQNFIFLTINRFGSLVNTTITTTCKFVSIVVSSLLSGNPLSTNQGNGDAFLWYSLDYHIKSTSSGRSCRDCREKPCEDEQLSTVLN